MLKEPRLGRVKTRLGRDIGMVRAVWWYRHQALRTIRCLDDRRWHLVLAISPDIQVIKSRFWPTHLKKIPQGGGSLGMRMSKIFDQLPPGPVCIIGSDIPAITRHHIVRAFDGLGKNEWVFGPSIDGGYWLVGAKRVSAVPQGLFQGVRWSTAHALSDSRRTIQSNRVAFLDQLADVDRGSDLKKKVLLQRKSH
ncbi:MAG: glycosyltransferase [Marinovum sp.]|nr:glycosyltransferase [Marinovum sp.]